LPGWVFTNYTSTVKKLGTRCWLQIQRITGNHFFTNTHDVTTEIQKGNNAIATVLGNGRFFTMRQNYKTQKHNTFGYPKLLLQLEIEYVNGTKKLIVSDQSWKLNVDGPIRTNNEYDGEEYDATKEFPGWNAAGFNDSKWMKPQLVTAPSGKILAQFSAPMKIKPGHSTFVHKKSHEREIHY
jgi:alpha-L-rhamnosidase